MNESISIYMFFFHYLELNKRPIGPKIDPFLSFALVPLGSNDDTKGKG